MGQNLFLYQSAEPIQSPERRFAQGFSYWLANKSGTAVSLPEKPAASHGQTPASLCLLAVIATLLTVGSVLLGTTYLANLVERQIEQSHRPGLQQVSYSDLEKRAGH